MLGFLSTTYLSKEKCEREKGKNRRTGCLSKQAAIDDETSVLFVGVSSHISLTEAPCDRGSRVLSNHIRVTT